MQTEGYIIIISISMLRCVCVCVWQRNIDRRTERSTNMLGANAVFIVLSFCDHKAMQEKYAENKES